MQPIFEFQYRFDEQSLWEEFRKNLAKTPDGHRYEYIDQERSARGKSYSDLIVYNLFRESDFHDPGVFAQALGFLETFCLKDEIVCSFFQLKAHARMGWHTDDPRVCTCAVNYVLSGHASASIQFNEGEYFYKLALLDVGQNHAVFNGPEDRVIFRISFKSLEFWQVKDAIGRRLQTTSMLDCPGALNWK